MNIKYDKKCPGITEEEFHGMKNQFFSQNANEGKLTVNYGFFYSPPDQQRWQVVSILKIDENNMQKVFNINLDLEGNIVHVDRFDVARTTEVRKYEMHSHYFANYDSEEEFQERKNDETSLFKLSKKPTEPGQSQNYEMFEKKGEYLFESKKYEVKNKQKITETLDSLVEACKEAFALLKIKEKIEAAKLVEKCAAHIDNALFNKTTTKVKQNVRR